MNVVNVSMESVLTKPSIFLHHCIIQRCLKITQENCPGLDTSLFQLTLFTQNQRKKFPMKLITTTIKERTMTEVSTLMSKF